MFQALHQGFHDVLLYVLLGAIKRHLRHAQAHHSGDRKPILAGSGERCAAERGAEISERRIPALVAHFARQCAALALHDLGVDLVTLAACGVPAVSLESAADGAARSVNGNGTAYAHTAAANGRSRTADVAADPTCLYFVILRNLLPQYRFYAPAGSLECPVEKLVHFVFGMHSAKGVNGFLGIADVNIQINSTSGHKQPLQSAEIENGQRFYPLPISYDNSIVACQALRIKREFSFWR